MNLIAGIQPSLAVSNREPLMTLRYESLSKNTLKAYLADVSLFCHWLIDCQNANKPDLNQLSTTKMASILQSAPITAAVICRYIEDIGFQYKINSIQRKLASIAWALNQLGLNNSVKNPAVRDSFRGLRKLHAQFASNLIDENALTAKGLNAPSYESSFYLKKSAPALRLTMLLRVFRSLDEHKEKTPTNTMLRDKALLSLWWAGAFRRSEIAKLQWSFIDFQQEGVKITLPFSKTDQQGIGIRKGITYATKHIEICAVTHLKNWLNAQTDPTRRFVFSRLSYTGNPQDDKPLSDLAIVKILRRHLKNANIPDFQLFSGHSPRRGFVTEAYHAGASSRSIQKQGGWRSESMINTYIEEDSLFERNATQAVL